MADVEGVEDMAKFEEQVKILANRRQKIADDYTGFANRISTQIEKILRDAEVWDVIRALEVGKEKRRADDQAQADLIGKQLEELASKRAAFVAAAAAPVVEPVEAVEPEVIVEPVRKAPAK